MISQGNEKIQINEFSNSFLITLQNTHTTFRCSNLLVTVDTVFVNKINIDLKKNICVNLNVRNTDTVLSVTDIEKFRFPNAVVEVDNNGEF